MFQKKMLFAALFILPINASTHGRINVNEVLNVTEQQCFEANTFEKAKKLVFILKLKSQIEHLNRLDDAVRSHEYTIHTFGKQVTPERIAAHQQAIKKLHDERSQCIQRMRNFVKDPRVTSVGINFDMDSYVEQRKKERQIARQAGDKDNKQCFGKR